ncbi:rRNA-processing protein EFG1 [Carpediemonas membranifera]|uniref:rRNA-processing protein EFG1 n=1 Tax=Carpediemonas membranifera TaxID=201153 RepID=A0A8J6B307_9EUKA|nr:rRNA-processing protein EFG1 [Carpediemonas membranifera]|eukprot:KAG9391859.1 rRNA-processing protein EFG1 [Carpediemonas membranifera]
MATETAKTLKAKRQSLKRLRRKLGDAEESQRKKIEQQLGDIEKKLKLRHVELTKQKATKKKFKDLRFVERTKVKRSIEKTKKNLEAAVLKFQSLDDDDDTAKQAAIAELVRLKEEGAVLDSQLTYVELFPEDENYLPLFGKLSFDKLAQRKEIMDRLCEQQKAKEVQEDEDEEESVSDEEVEAETEPHQPAETPESGSESSESSGSESD